MKSILTIGAAALALTVALPAAAQSAGAMAPSAETPAAATSPAATTGAKADASATAATLAVGLSVKDNTGATIGSITQIKPDTTGKQVATIKMGTETFAVDGANLAVQDGSAVINATQAELQGMIKKSAPAKKPG
ncbi:MAG TPA: hypothetical protein VFW47_10005 [Phenylobacterium sp.]|nr:hypothetical protein [Phenylobacterium sp.]